MPTLNYMPAWSVSYDYDINHAISRNRSGESVQKRISFKNTMIANAQRRLILSQLPYFEYFIREVCNDGQLQFTDVYADYNGLNVGTVRILGGRYTVQTDLREHIITCELEIFR